MHIYTSVLDQDPVGSEIISGSGSQTIILGSRSNKFQIYVTKIGQKFTDFRD